MLLQVIENTGCYILPSLKDFVPEIFKLGRTYPTIQHPSTQNIIHEQSLSLQDSKCCMNICKGVCICTYLMQISSMQIMLVKWIHMYAIPNIMYNIYMCAHNIHPYATSVW